VWLGVEIHRTKRFTTPISRHPTPFSEKLADQILGVAGRVAGDLKKDESLLVVLQPLRS
jgi:hypothetical protein